jgi:surfeit locus 1 family protein
VTAQAAPRLRFFLSAVVVVAALAILVSLGTWQLDRKAQKEALIALLDSRLAAPPAPLSATGFWPSDPGEDEFTRVTFPAEFARGEEAFVYTSGSGLRPDVKEPGYWVLSPAHLPDGRTVIVNRGFVPDARRDAATRADGEPKGKVTIVGEIRAPEPRGLFTPKDEPAKNLWFVRDPAAIAAAKGWGAVAPFYIDQEAPQAPGGLPRVGPLKMSLPNNHLQYAVTWYGLAASLVVISLAFAFSRRRRQAGEA